MSLLNLIPAPYRLLALLLVAAALAAAGFAGGWIVNGWRLGDELQTVKAQHSQAVAAAAQAALEQAGEYRLEEYRMDDNVRKAEDALKIATQNNQRIADGLAAKRIELRNALANYAAGSAATQDTLAACRRDAATLGDVLADSMQREEVVTRAAETHAASTRTLLAGWPRQPGR